MSSTLSSLPSVKAFRKTARVLAFWAHDLVRGVYVRLILPRCMVKPRFATAPLGCCFGRLGLELPNCLGQLLVAVPVAVAAAGVRSVLSGLALIGLKGFVLPRPV